MIKNIFMTTMRELGGMNNSCKKVVFVLFDDCNFDIGHPVFLYEQKRKSNLIEYRKNYL